MKNLLLIILFITGIFYFFVPYDIQISLLERVGIESSFLPLPNKVIEEKKGGVIDLKFDNNNKAEYTGNISNGNIMTDLSWAVKPLIKCFNPSDYGNFSGNMVLHRILLGKNKVANIKLISDNKDKKLVMYVYKTDPLSKVFPPEKDYMHECKINISEDLVKEIEIKGNTLTSDIVVGVSGSGGVLDGGYTLEIIEK